MAEGPLAGDGATGTELVARGASPAACFDVLSLTDRDLVREVHRAYVEAGAQVVESNTFGANRYKLAAHDFGGRVHEVNVAGVARAREAGARLVAGSVGPLGVRLAPYGRVPAADARAAFAEQIAALAEGGADLLVLETHSDLAELEQAILAAREVCGLPVVATLTFTRDDRTLLGESATDAARRLLDLDVDAAGVNCSEGPEQVLRLVGRMRRVAPGVPLVAQPNAGAPQRLGDRIMFSAAPEYFAEYVPAFRAAGVWLIGGCCGTRPAHVEAIAAALRSGAAAPVVTVEEPDEPGTEAAVAEEPSPLALRLASGRKVLAVEMEPPRGFSPARIVAGAETLRDAGADVVNVSDSPMAKMRMSPWAACHAIQTEAGIDTVLHFPTRGRNILRVQSDLLAVYALGIRTIFAVMGDSTSIGDFPEAADLADVTPSGLIALIKGNLNTGIDRKGSSIGEATRFTVACALNLNASDIDREARVLARKIAAGADFALTQAVFDPARIDKFRAAYEESHGPLALPILVGVLPIASARHAEFLHNEVPGIDIPEEVRARIAGASDQRAEGIRLAGELYAASVDRVAGAYLIPPFRRYDVAAEVVELLRANDPPAPKE